MATVRVGGDPESYMDAPALSSGGGESGGGSFFGSLLNFLGVGKVVGQLEDKVTGKKDQKAAESAANVEPAGTSQAAPSEAGGASKLLDGVSSAIGMRDADKNNYLTPVDPDIAALLPRTSL